MDNQSNPNWPNSPTPPPSLGGTTPPTPTTDFNSPLPTSTLPNQDPTQTIPHTTDLPSSPTTSESTLPNQSSSLPNPLPSPQPLLDPASSAWTPPTPNPTYPPYSPPTSNPIDSTPLSTNGHFGTPSLPSESIGSPIPSFAQAPDQSALPNSTTSPTSSLDNPWNAPTPQPTWTPSPTLPNSPTSAAEPTHMESALPPTGGQAEPNHSLTESAPTDLSHLISNNASQDVGQNPAAGSETLIIPQAANNVAAEIPTIPTENRKSIPKWLIGLGIGLLIIVAGASAYFILGVGQPTKNNDSTSVPAQVSKTTVKTPPPIATSGSESSNPAATGSANFGQLQNNSTTPSATSAADLLKQRQSAK